MNGDVSYGEVLRRDGRHPWQRPLLPQFVSYFLVLAAYMAFTLALLYILFDSPT